MQRHIVLLIADLLNSTFRCSVPTFGHENRLNKILLMQFVVPWESGSKTSYLVMKKTKVRVSFADSLHLSSFKQLLYVFLC